MYTRALWQYRQSDAGSQANGLLKEAFAANPPPRMVAGTVSVATSVNCLGPDSKGVRLNLHRLGGAQEV